MIALLQHAEIEGPGTVTRFCRPGAGAVTTFKLYQGVQLPAVSSCEAVIIMGGPMNVYEEREYPFLKQEHHFLKEILKKEIPALGICLGAQLLSKAAGGKITKAAHEEIGWHSVTLTDEGKNDEIFRGMQDDLLVFQWHRDTFSLSHNAKLLAMNSGCPHQAVRIGECAWGLQYHPEITSELISSWCDSCAGPIDKEALLIQYEEYRNDYDAQAAILFNNFERVIAGREGLVS